MSYKCNHTIYSLSGYLLSLNSTYLRFTHGFIWLNASLFLLLVFHFMYISHCIYSLIEGCLNGFSSSYWWVNLLQTLRSFSMHWDYTNSCWSPILSLLPPKLSLFHFSKFFMSFPYSLTGLYLSVQIRHIYISMYIFVIKTQIGNLGYTIWYFNITFL